MKAIRAMSQTELARQRSRLEREYAAANQRIVALQAQQDKVQRTLSRINIQAALLGKRTVPPYAAWLPFSSNGKN